MLINNDATLRQFFPNAWSTVNGETPFFKRLEPYLIQAEKWISDHLMPEDILSFFSSDEEKASANALNTPSYEEGPREDTSSDQSEDKPNVVISEALRTAVLQLVVSLAMRNAAPQLDLALTANGFVTAGTDSAVPISSQRMERLLHSLSANADGNIDTILRSLHSLPGWVFSHHAQFFAQTLFQDFNITLLVHSVKEATNYSLPTWSRYLSLREKAIEIEGLLADSYISHELMNALRQRLLCRKLRVMDVRVINNVQAEVVSILNGHCINHSFMSDTVQFIRSHPDNFVEWNTSATAKLFDPPVFHNVKKSGGYFF